MHARSIYDLTREELAELCAELGEPAFRVGQIWHALYRDRIDDWDCITTIPKALRAQLAASHPLTRGRLVRAEGEAGGTRKLLLDLGDEALVECVLIPVQTRRTVCLSSQVGCKFGCVFCASGQGGFTRNLTAGEIVGQFLHAADAFADTPTHVVFMGMGEPLDNYDAVMQAIHILNDHDGLDIGARRITISTVGVVPGISRLAGEGIQVELSVSLHTADDVARSRLLPVNRRYPLDVLIPACREYTRDTGRIITFEYTLIAGENDGRAHAEQLAARLGGFPNRVNLIRLNPIAEYDGVACARQTADMFVKVLQSRGINATFRDSRGRRINAACGQLRAQHRAEHA